MKSPPQESPLAGGPGECNRDEELFARLLARHPNVNLMSPSDLREVLREWMEFMTAKAPRFISLTAPGGRTFPVNAHHISWAIHSNESDRHQCLTAVQILGEEKPWLVLESEGVVVSKISKAKEGL